MYQSHVFFDKGKNQTRHLSNNSKESGSYKAMYARVFIEYGCLVCILLKLNLYQIDKCIIVCGILRYCRNLNSIKI